MRLASVLVGGAPRLALVEGGKVYLALLNGSQVDPAEFFRDPGKLVGKLERGEPVQGLDRPLEPPVPQPSKIIGIGKNYAAHAREMGSAERPVFFMKAPSALTGHLHSIEVPEFIQKPDYEGEVVIVIGRAVKHADRREAQEAILGYMAGNDVTARELQYDERLPWCLSKSLDTFSPTGPYVKVLEDYSELQGSCVETYINGERVQHGCADEMTYDFADIVVELSKYMKLYPGDLIFTGTPPGVGHPRGRYLKDGDRVEIVVKGLDPLVNVVARPSGPRSS
ncbi:fumarylacetoacetate hydrolase family protein [Acidilobus sp.]|uniref:fumarylacetoacetate hydrolase family protein n=1 Tax=Acidilobus sp. TaxID=1872109 RepID=UPI003D03CA8B